MFCSAVCFHVARKENIYATHGEQNLYKVRSTGLLPGPGLTAMRHAMPCPPINVLASLAPLAAREIQGAALRLRAVASNSERQV